MYPTMANVDRWTLAYGVLALIGATTLFNIVYNIFFHPLRSFPGPFWHRASRLPFAWDAIRGNNARHMYDMHQKYGRVVRVGPNHLSFTDAQSWKDIYGHRTGAQHSQTPEHAKSTVFYRSIANVAKHIINADRSEHTLLRRAMSHGFSDKSIRNQEVLIKRYVDLLVKRLHENCSDGEKPLNMVPWYNWTTFDIIGDLVFAESFGCLEEQRYHPFVHMIIKTIAVGGIRVFTGYLNLDFIANFMMAISSFQRPFLELIEGMHVKLKKRLENPVERDDLFEGLMKHRKDWNLEMKSLQSNAVIIVVAGSETTATLLSGVTYLLLSNPEAMEKLKHEVRSTFKRADEITFASAGKLDYMLACLNEALRHYPPAPINLVRDVAPGGAVIAGHAVPERTMVESSQWAMYHDDEYWRDPWAFKPERFLVDESTADGTDGEARDMFEALQPFSYGPRNCIGRNLAYAEMRLILARVIFDFDMRLDDNSKLWIERQKTYGLWDKLPLNVYLTPVDHSATTPVPVVM
ncbi:cytochrome P450 ClCP1 [Lasiosphaeria ovina]|uniref:Cytochrome P450 ClCP1 n=1 Tax=Lasiosphaeria ovina TaxID=92902 RepID=A0AAE0JRI7_9PEZI|nr:cytochrome P450 ClCP1 [Lasiosphaeria ovina]